MTQSLFEKVWNAHVVEQLPGGNALLFVDRIVAHEITTPQGALEIQQRYGDELFAKKRIVAMNDHVSRAKDTETAIQAKLLREWAKRHGITLYDIGDNGICHVIAPERGHIEPGMTRSEEYRDGDPSQTLARVGEASRHHALRHRRQRDLSRDRAGARSHRARDDRDLRRQPHLYARRFRCVRARHWDDRADRRDALRLRRPRTTEGHARDGERPARPWRGGEVSRALRQLDVDVQGRDRLRDRVPR